MIMGMCIGCSPYNAEQSVIMQAIAILRRFGSDAHVYLPGVGMLNGLTAANYLDSAGTTQGTVDQPVGLVLDAAGGLGVELVVAIDYTSNGATADLGGGLYKFTANGGADPYVRFVVTQPAISGKTFRLRGTAWTDAGQPTTLSFFSYTAAGGEVQQPNFTLGASTGAFEYIRNFVGGTSDLTVRYDMPDSSANGTYFYFRLPSVREVTGIAASQPTTASKPILRRGGVNLALWSQDLTNAAYNSTTNATRSAVAGAAPDGTGASRLQITSGGGALKQSGFALNTDYTQAVWVKSNTGANQQCQFWEGTAYATLVPFTATTEWQLFTARMKDSASARIDFGSATNGADLLIWRAALFAGTYTAAQIQALGGIPATTTAPASTALGPQYWSFDGSNDSLSLGSVPFQMADDHWVVAVASASSISANGTLFSNGSTLNASPLAPLLRVAQGGSLSAIWREDSASASIVSGGSISAQEVFVASATKTGDVKKLRKNGVLLGSNTDARGAATLNNAAVGVLVQPTLVQYHTGNIYPIAFGKGTMTDADLLLIEKALGQIAGVQI